MGTGSTPRVHAVSAFRARTLDDKRKLVKGRPAAQVTMASCRKRSRTVQQHWHGHGELGMGHAHGACMGTCGRAARQLQ